jgi:hypothetical protein
MEKMEKETDRDEGQVMEQYLDGGDQKSVPPELRSPMFHCDLDFHRA